LLVLRLPERAGVPCPFRRRYCTAALADVRFQPDGKTLTLLQNNGREWEKVHGVQTVVFFDVDRNMDTGSHAIRCRSAAHDFSPNLEWLAATDGPAVVLEHARENDKGCRLACGKRQDLGALAFSPDNQTLASGDSEGVVKLWPWRKLADA